MFVLKLDGFRTLIEKYLVLSAHGSPNFGKKINQLFCYRHHFQNFYILKLVFKVFFFKIQKTLFPFATEELHLNLSHNLSVYMLFSLKSCPFLFIFYDCIMSADYNITRIDITNIAILFLLFKNWNNECVLIFTVFQSGIVNICVLTG